VVTRHDGHELRRLAQRFDRRNVHRKVLLKEGH
jgi:hypothetical protein